MHNLLNVCLPAFWEKLMLVKLLQSPYRIHQCSLTVWLGGESWERCLTTFGGIFFCHFSLKIQIVGCHYYCLGEAIVMSTRNESLWHKKNENV